MVRVCTDFYPAGFGRNRFPGFYMDNKLKAQLDILIKNIVNDWDFTILITGSGEVRVGKSVLGMEIAAYWSYMVKKLHNKKTIFDIKNFVFDGRKLIEQGNYIGQNFPYSPLIYDEAGADLSGIKMMNQITQDVLDFYRECGQYNLLNILVLPDFFDLPKPIAITRSIFLINVDYESDEEGIFRRGIGKFYSRKNKKWLYLKGKKTLDYNAQSYDFSFRFLPFYPIKEDDYRMSKVHALRHRETRRANVVLDQRDFAWWRLHVEFNISLAEIAKRTTDITGKFVSNVTVFDAIQRFYPRE